LGNRKGIGTRGILMAAIHKLATRSVFTADIRKYADGGNLYLIVKTTGASWVLRYTSPSGRQREMGLGPCLRDTQKAAGASLTRARKAAGKAREVLDAGGDPLEVRRVEREAARAADEAAKAEKQRDRATLARVCVHPDPRSRRAPLRPLAPWT